MRRAAILLASIALHAVALTLTTIPAFFGGIPEHDVPVHEVELVRLEPEPEAPRPETRPEKPAPPKPKSPEPKPQPKQAKPAPRQSKPAPPKPRPQASPAPPPAQTATGLQDASLGPVDESGLKVGAEARFHTGSLAGYDFNDEDFVGQYDFGEEDREVYIIDARKTHGRLILYDSEAGIYRSLRRYNKYTYTYGSSFHEDFPVEGSITFLPDGDRISRVIYMPEGLPARFPVKIQFREKKARFTVRGEGRTGTLIRHPDSKSPPVVVWAASDSCAGQGMVHGLARMLALHGIAVLVLDPPGCGEGSSASPPDAETLLAAQEYLDDLDEEPLGPVGLWVLKDAVPVALDALRREDDFAFLVASTAGPVSRERVAAPSGLLPPDGTGPPVPALLLFGCAEPVAPCVEQARTLAGMYALQGVPLRLAAMGVADSARDADTPETDADDLWFKELSPEFAREAASWILSLTRP